MPRAQGVQNSFVAGEVSPYYLGRSDLDKYKHACESIQNYIVKPTGGVQRRYGTTYVCDAGGPARLMKFVISNDLSYILEFGNGYLRFYIHHQQIQSGGAPYTIGTPYNTAVDDLWDLKIAQIASVAYITHPNHPVMKLVRINDTEWFFTQPGFYARPANKSDLDYSDGTISMSISGNVATASQPFFIAGDVGRAITVPNTDTGVGYITQVTGGTATDGSTGSTLYTQAILNVIDSFQHTNYSPGQWLFRGGPLSYFSVGTFSSPGWHASGQFNYGKSIAVRATTKHPTDNTFQISTGSAYENVPYTGGFTDSFRVLDQGLYVPFAGGYCQITSVNSSDSINATVLGVPDQSENNAFGNAIIAPSPPGGWWFELPEFTNGNYPRAVAAFQDRLWFASTPNNPTTLWASVTSDYENFAVGNLDTAGLRFTISSGTLDQILWMIAFQGFIIAGTYQGEYTINGGTGEAVQSPGAPITPTNINIIRQSIFGVARTQALIARSDVIYVQRGGTELYELAFNAITNAYDSTQINLISETIITGVVKDLDFQTLPWHTIWIVDSSGNLVGMTYDKINGVYAWHRHFTGNLDIVDNADIFLSVAVIPSDDPVNQQLDDIYFVVQRIRNGLTYYTIEYMVDAELNLDCATHTIFTTPVTTIGNLQYLQGRQYYVVADGNVFGPQLMDATGNFTFPPGVQVTNVQAGLMYNSSLTTVRFERTGSNGLIKRFLRLWARVFDTVNVLINGQRRTTRTTTTPFNGSTPPFTGDLDVINQGFDRDARIVITQNQPLPSVVLSAFGTVEVSDGV